MTKKDYIIIADAFIRSRPDDIDSNYHIWGQWNSDLDSIIWELRHDNVRFDEGKFRDYIRKGKMS